MSNSIHMCGENDLTIPECSDCAALEAEIASVKADLDECCDSVKDTLSSHATELSSLNDDVDNLALRLEALTGLVVVTVDALPETGATNTIYLVDNGNYSDMYMYVSEEWVKIGDTSIDLTEYTKTSDLVNVIYPVGSIYMSVNSADPSLLFGGTWERIQARFLLGAGYGYEAGSTDGRADAIVPNHNHGIASFTFMSGSHSHYADSSRTKYFLISPDATTGDQSSGMAGSGYIYPRTLTSGWEHNKTTQTAAVNITVPHHYTETVGSDATGANMPPYLAVYMWKRIS